MLYPLHTLLNCASALCGERQSSNQIVYKVSIKVIDSHRSSSSHGALQSKFDFWGSRKQLLSTERVLSSSFCPAAPLIKKRISEYTRGTLPLWGISLFNR